MANGVDPDETPRSAVSHLGLNCLLRPVCPNTYGKYGIYCFHGNFRNHCLQMDQMFLTIHSLNSTDAFCLFFAPFLCQKNLKSHSGLQQTTSIVLFY